MKLSPPSPHPTIERYCFPDGQSKHEQLNTCPNFTADPVPKLQRGACAVIAQLCYQIFMEPAKCCVATCHVSTAWHLLLRDPGGGRSHRVQPLLTTATKKTGNNVDETSRPPIFSVASLPAPCCCFPPQAGQLSAGFPSRGAGQQGSLGS